MLLFLDFRKPEKSLVLDHLTFCNIVRLSRVFLFIIRSLEKRLSCLKNPFFVDALVDFFVDARYCKGDTFLSKQFWSK